MNSIQAVGKACCGCRTCKTICPAKAISFIYDQYQFEQPHVAKEKCIDCGKCLSVCPALQCSPKHQPCECGAAYALDEKVRSLGSSGGLFGLLAEAVLKSGGLVFGAAFDQNLQLKTTAAKSHSELIPLYKSKYLLCDTDDQFIHIRTELKNGNNVLYCSSPCQVSALKLFLGGDNPRLLTVDFVCHGVGSQKIFDQSISYAQTKLSAEIKQVTFREKKKHAATHHYYRYTGNRKGKPWEKRGLYLSFPYFNAYCKQLLCRESCYTCKYATQNRVSDLTIGDFHNIEAYKPVDDRFAVSMFICNTKKGQKYMNDISSQLYVETMDKGILYQNNRFDNQNSGPPQQRAAFLHSLANEPFEKTVAKFLLPRYDWKRLIYYFSPKPIRDLARKMLE